MDLAGTVPRAQLAKALNEAERQRVFDLRAIERAMAATARRRGKGNAAMRQALEELQAIGAHVTRSDLEDRFLHLLDAHDLPRPQANYGIEGMEVDVAWADVTRRPGDTVARVARALRRGRRYPPDS